MNASKLAVIIGLLLAPLVLTSYAYGAEPLAQQIVAQADEIRFPTAGFQVKIRVTSERRGRREVARVYQVLSKGNARTLVLTREPADERGQMLLMRDKDLWVFMPAVSQPVRLPLSQKLTGQVANGDLARANFTGDYTPKHVREEACGEHSCYVLELTAARRGVTYHKVMYWVRTDNHWPHRAEFYTVSGRLLKTAHYGEFKSLGGKVRPTRLTLTDAARGGEVSIMDYSNMKNRKLPAKVFTKQYLQKLK